MANEQVFQSEIEKLDSVKKGVLKAIQPSQDVRPSPTAVDVFNKFNLFLDTAYLWMLQLQALVMNGGAVMDIEQAVDEALEKGEVIQFPEGGKA